MDDERRIQLVNGFYDEWQAKREERGERREDR